MTSLNVDHTKHQSSRVHDHRRKSTYRQAAKSKRIKADEAKSSRESAREANVKWLVSTDGVKAEMLLKSMKFGSATLVERLTPPSRSSLAELHTLCSNLCAEPRKQDRPRLHED